MATYSIFGCGPGGLYTAWRLLETGKLTSADTLDLYDWGNYDFAGQAGSRAPAGRICTYHYQGNPESSYIEVGGMRYIEWDGSETGSGHRLVTTVIERMGLDGTSVPFDTTDNPLFYLRQKHFYSKDISPSNPAPYNSNHDLAQYPPEKAYSYVAAQAMGSQNPGTRSKQCSFYQDGTLAEGSGSQAFLAGDPLKNIGYWNLMFDLIGNEGYDYADAGGGYASNVINWNAADALIYNSEFSPGGQFKTLSNGYSSLFVALFAAIEDLAAQRGVTLHYHPGTRLRSIYLDGGVIHFTFATAADPYRSTGTFTTDQAFLCMPPASLELVAQGSRFLEGGSIVDVLNAQQVALYRDSVVLQPSYKVAMFFDSPWWTSAPYAPDLATPTTYGPTITDTPIRQIYYFGNNAPGSSGSPVYALLASYDDESFVEFWREMELGTGELRTVPPSWSTQPLTGPQPAPDAMVAMLRDQLAEVHFGAGSSLDQVPMPLETRFMDWSQKPFSAGYHAWAPHYDIDDVMDKIRKPTQLLEGADAGIYIVGSAYSNDQAWIEGAFCTAESVLDQFFDLTPIIDPTNYPFICGGCGD